MPCQKASERVTSERDEPTEETLESVTLTFANHDSLDPHWRALAVARAVKRGLVAHVYRDNAQRCICIDADGKQTVVHVGVLSLTVTCMCEAGKWHAPCAHAGATLLFLFGLAPERGKRT